MKEEPIQQELNVLVVAIYLFVDLPEYQTMQLPLVPDQADRSSQSDAETQQLHDHNDSETVNLQDIRPSLQGSAVGSRTQRERPNAKTRSALWAEKSSGSGMDRQFLAPIFSAEE